MVVTSIAGIVGARLARPIVSDAADVVGYVAPPVQLSA
jgi:hypothetical protein